jgi:hypothetical protein
MLAGLNETGHKALRVRNCGVGLPNWVVCALYSRRYIRLHLCPRGLQLNAPFHAWQPGVYVEPEGIPAARQV